MSGMCEPPCEPRSMLGRSWWKNLGYNTPCKCADTLYEKGYRYMSDHVCMTCHQPDPCKCEQLKEGSEGMSNEKELLQGAAGIRITVTNGMMYIHHDTDKNLLHERPIYEVEWDELWTFLKREVKA